MTRQESIGSSCDEIRELTQIICWTRMQAESGQDIATIVNRKELERRSGSGLFFWGVGNAPNRSIPRLSNMAEDVDLVFSLMKSRPQKRDSSPSRIVVWNSYFDADGREKTIPPNIVVTSRMKGEVGSVRAHYALVCRADEQLSISDFGPFSPSHYRNVGPNSGRIAPSQVTALAVRIGNEETDRGYRINMRAKLTGSYWVKLGSPKLLSAKEREHLNSAGSASCVTSIDDWRETVSIVRPIKEKCNRRQRVKAKGKFNLVCS